MYYLGQTAFKLIAILFLSCHDTIPILNYIVQMQTFASHFGIINIIYLVCHRIHGNTNKAGGFYVLYEVQRREGEGKGEEGEREG